MKDAHYLSLYTTEKDHWWYRVRRSLVHNLIKKHFPAGRPKILDLGCGTGILMTELERYADVTGVDFSEQAVNFSRERGLRNVSLGDATKISFAGESFDIVLALDVLEHIKDDSKAISEIRRVLKPGGKTIIFVPTFKILWSVTDELSEHHRRYNLKMLKRLLKKEGFSIARASYFNFILFIPILLVRVIVRLLNINMKSENSMGGPIINSILYRIFSAEIPLLRFMNFPFGVSVMVIAEKVDPDRSRDRYGNIPNA